MAAFRFQGLQTLCRLYYFVLLGIVGLHLVFVFHGLFWRCEHVDLL